MRIDPAPPIRFTLHPDDHDRYGDGAWVYDETALARLPVRELMEIESAVGMALPTVMVRLRRDFADGKLAALWIARRQAGIVEPYDTFEPLVTLMRVQPSEADADPPDQGGDSTPSTDPPPSSSKRGSRGSPSTRASRRTTSTTSA